MSKVRLFLILSVLLVILKFFLPGLGGFTPFFSIAFFSGYIFRDNKKMSIIFCLACLLLSDCLYQILYLLKLSEFGGFYGYTQFVNYLFLLSISFWGMCVKRSSVFNFVLSNVGSTVLYFIISNWYVWVSVSHIFLNLSDVYLLGIPFFCNGILATIFFTSIFLITEKIIELKELGYN